MSSILRYTKEVYRAFKEVNGKLKLDTSSSIGRMRLSDESIAFLSDYMDFVLKSGIISEITTIYIKSIENNLQDAIRAHNMYSNEYDAITPKQASNSIYYDTNKLLKLFPDDMLMNILYQRADLVVYRALLQNAIDKKLGKTLLGKMTNLKLPSAISKERPSEDSIDQFFMLFAPYTKEVMKSVEDQLPVDVVGYINYISSKSQLEPEEKEILARLKQLNELRNN